MFKRRRREDAELNLNSFSDIAFLLIIFFILTTTFIRTQGTKMQIPAGDNADSQQAEKTPTIALTRAEVLLNDKPVGLPELRTWLDNQKYRELPEESEGRIVILEAAEDVPYQRYFSVVTMLNNAGAVMAVLTEEKSD